MMSDRYILNRNFLDVDESNYWLQKSTLKERIDIYRKTTALNRQDVRQPERIEYINQLRRIFDINENRCSILPLAGSAKISSDENDFENQQWPVRSRQRPVNKAQLAVLDLPNIRNDICSNVTDWTSNNHIVAALGRVIWIWNVSTSKMLHHIDCCNEVVALKADLNSNILAFSCKDLTNGGMCALKVWSFETYKIKTKLGALDCSHRGCHITCIDFHPSNKYIIVGCKFGNIGMLDMELNRLITVRHAHHDSDVLRIKTSPDGGYIASCGYDGYVQVRTFADFRIVYSYYQPFCTRGLSWHPWKHSLLCIGTSNGHLSLVNVSMGKLIHTKREANTIIYEVTFNKLSAELVVSLTYFERGNPDSYKSQINVLANFNQVVDRFEGHCKRVLFLEWSPDNKTLASAGSDETIHLWNFFEKKAGSGKKFKDDHRMRFNLVNYIR